MLPDSSKDNNMLDILGWLGIQNCQEIFNTIYLNLNWYICQQSSKCKFAAITGLKADIKVSIW